MTKDPICAKQTCPPEKIISIMLTRSFRHLPVVDENRCLVRLLDILGIATIIKNEIERQKAAEEEARNRRGWFSKALNMISQFVQNPFFSRRSILTMLDHDGGLKHHLGRKLRYFLISSATVAKAVQRMQQLRLSAVLVEDTSGKGRLVGILTERDIVTKVIAEG